MDSLRVLHVLPYYEDGWAYGGIPRAAAALARAQAATGHAVTVVTTDAGDADRRAPLGIADRGGVTVHTFPNLSNPLAYRQMFAPLGLGAWMRRHAGEFDVAHLHGCRHLPGAIAARALARADVPWVLSPHGTAPLIERRVFAKRMFDRIVGRRAVLDAAAVIAATNAERRDLLREGVDASRAHVIAPAVELGEFQTPLTRGRWRERLGTGGAPLVVFLGKLTPRKRLDVLVDAFHRLGRDDARLVIAGNDMGAGRAAAAQVSRLGLTTRAHFTGLLTGRARLELLADADVVAYASEDEIFGLVPLEALLAGSPVVVADDSGAGEVVASVGGGLVVQAGDADALASALATLLTQPEASRAAARAAADVVRQRYAPHEIARQTTRSYDAVTARARVHESITFVIPVKNGARWLRDVLDAVLVEASGRPAEIFVVDDGSTDDTPALLAPYQRDGRVRVLAGEQRGAAAAINLGIRHATGDVICQVDQDVILQRGWLDRVLQPLATRDVAASQGWYTTPRDGGVWARVMGLDLEDRYRRVRGRHLDHVCTGNTAYRATALRAVALFDETLGYGYDNDLSYRLGAAGYRLAFARGARSVHRWREGIAAYLRQQYGVGYGRLDVIGKHPGRVGGDDVSRVDMIAHAGLMLVAVVAGGGALAAAALGTSARAAGTISAAIVLSLALERTVAGARAAWQSGDLAGFCFAPVHLARDLAWCAAIGVWTLRRVAARRRRPAHSM